MAFIANMVGKSWKNGQLTVELEYPDGAGKRQGLKGLL